MNSAMGKVTDVSQYINDKSVAHVGVRMEDKSAFGYTYGWVSLTIPMARANEFYVGQRIKITFEVQS